MRFSSWPYLQTKISLARKHLRSLGSMQNMSALVRSILRKHMTGFLKTDFGEFFGSTVFMAAFYWQSSRWNPAQTFLPVSTELLRTTSAYGGCSISTRVCKILGARKIWGGIALECSPWLRAWSSDGVFFCCTVHVITSVTLQQINFSVVIRNFSISMKFKQRLASGVINSEEVPKLLILRFRVPIYQALVEVIELVLFSA